MLIQQTRIIRYELLHQSAIDQSGVRSTSVLVIGGRLVGRCRCGSRSRLRRSGGRSGLVGSRSGSGRVLGLTLIGDLGLVAAVGINGVSHLLGAAVGKGNIVRAGGLVSVALLLLAVVVAGVLIVDGPVKGVLGGSVGGLLVRGGCRGRLVRGGCRGGGRLVLLGSSRGHEGGSDSNKGLEEELC